MKPENLRNWLRPIRVLSYVPVSGNWYKTVSKLTQSLYLNKVMEPLKKFWLGFEVCILWIHFVFKWNHWGKAGEGGGSINPVYRIFRHLISQPYKISVLHKYTIFSIFLNIPINHPLNNLIT